MWYTVMEVLPERVGGFVAALFRKDGRRPADFFFPYGNMSSSQDFKRSVINNLLWVVVIFIKFLFDFFVVSKQCVIMCVYVPDAACIATLRWLPRWEVSEIGGELLLLYLLIP